MAASKRIKGVSSFTKQLLGEGETTRADFKRTSDGISADDFVAFANSESILRTLQARSVLIERVDTFALRVVP